MACGLPAKLAPASRLFPAEKLLIISVSFFSLLITADFFIRGGSSIYLLPLSLMVILLYLWLPQGRQKYQEQPAIFFVFSAWSLAGYAYLYKLAGALVTLLSSGWQDEFLAGLDRIIFGFSPNLAVVSYQRPWLTELMMLAYMAYLPLVVWLACQLFRQRGQEELQGYTFSLGLAYLTCFIIFILVPAASPRFYFEGLPPLSGLLLRKLMQLVEVSAQYRGGSFPSAHCAAGTVMMFFARRAGKKVFLVVTPLILLFFLSTIYGQYHYGVDVLAGVLVGLLAILVFALRLKRPGAALAKE
ncbi:MAG: phosphatase PAP2 family protein [Candidatus Aminicenantes bacterium]|nr:phosphatase PAP2 family protein [Candidatus Aminicenantes bacterium]